MVYILKDVRKRKRWFKSQGLADASPKECRQVKPDKDSWKAKDKQIARMVADKMQEDNVLHALPSFLKDMGVIRDRR